MPRNSEPVHCNKPPVRTRKLQRDRNCIKRRYGVERVSWSLAPSGRNVEGRYFPERKAQIRPPKQLRLTSLYCLIITLRILGYLPNARSRLLQDT